MLEFSFFFCFFVFTTKHFWNMSKSKYFTGQQYIVFIVFLTEWFFAKFHTSVATKRDTRVRHHNFCLVWDYHCRCIAPICFDVVEPPIRGCISDSSLSQNGLYRHLRQSMLCANRFPRNWNSSVSIGQLGSPLQNATSCNFRNQSLRHNPRGETHPCVSSPTVHVGRQSAYR